MYTSSRHLLANFESVLISSETTGGQNKALMFLQAHLHSVIHLTDIHGADSILELTDSFFFLGHKH